MEGRTCIITGATSGIGEATALALAERGAQLALVCRSRSRGEATQQRIERAAGRACVRLFEADFERLDDVRRVSDELLRELDRIDVLLNNAGVTLLKRSETTDGHETTFAVNHLAPFLLTHRLLGRLLENPEARIVNVASEAHRFARFDLADLQSERRYSAMRVYGASKLANLLFTEELSRRLEGRPIRIWSLHPGAVRTRLGANNGTLSKIVMPIAHLFMKSPEKGAETSVHLCSEPGLDAPNGTYFANARPKEPAARARDRDLAEHLWAQSEALAGIDKGEESTW